MLAIWSLVPLPFLHPAWTSQSSQFTYCWSLVWRILSITLLACEMSAVVWVWAFLGTAFLWDWNENWPFPVLLLLLSLLLGCWRRVFAIPVCSLDKILPASTLLHLVLHGQTRLLCWVSLDFLLLDQIPYNENNFFLFVFFFLIYITFRKHCRPS